MYKPEWGTKRTCPKCGTRFYDLCNEEPVACASCGHGWTPEPILKSKQPMPMEEETSAMPVPESADADIELDEDLEIGDEDMLDNVSLEDEDDDMTDVFEADREKGDD